MLSEPLSPRRWAKNALRNVTIVAGRGQQMCVIWEIILRNFWGNILRVGLTAR
jgi:hypothetical protein